MFDVNLRILLHQMLLEDVHVRIPPSVSCRVFPDDPGPFRRRSEPSSLLRISSIACTSSAPSPAPFPQRSYGTDDCSTTPKRRRHTASGAMEGPAKASAVSGFSKDDLAMSLVREFLHRGGLERTLACLDEERTEKGIGGGSGLTSRSSLRKAMGLERHAAKAKAKSEDNVTPTSLEVLVSVHMQRVEKQLQLTGDGRHVSSSSSSSSGPSVAERNSDILRSSVSLDGGRKLQRPMTAHSGFSRSRSSSLMRSSLAPSTSPVQSSERS